jgi:REP element-mobilizing transposase RayT
MAAYLITFTCYGSYIPGQQGAIDRDHNVPGSRLPGPRPKLRQHVDASLKQESYEMDQGQRAIVLKAIGEVCRYKCWRLLAAHVRSNHVHTVVDAEVAPEAVMNAFKSYASRALNLHAPGHYGRIRWARHGSTRHLWSPARVAAAVRYVLDEQGSRWLVTRRLRGVNISRLSAR